MAIFEVKLSERRNSVNYYVLNEMRTKILLTAIFVALGYISQSQEKWDLGTFVKTEENPILKADSS